MASFARKAMVANQMLDPIEAAQEGVGQSRRLIDASLDDLSKHHSWLETYHRDERLRAERLRRQEVLEKLELLWMRFYERTSRLAKTIYQVCRLMARLSWRWAKAFYAWAEPRAQKNAAIAAAQSSSAWRYGRQNTPVFLRQASKNVVEGFNWSVAASDRAGLAFRERAEDAIAKAHFDALERTAPMRRKRAYEVARARVRLRQARMRIEQSLEDRLRQSQTVQQVRQLAHRATIRSLRLTKREAARLDAHAERLEAILSKHILAAAPKVQHFLRTHMPESAGARKSSHALIVRPGTALVCIAPVRTGLPVPYGVFHDARRIAKI